MWCSLYYPATRLNEQQTCMRFLQFCKKQMYCWYIYFSVQTLLLLYSVVGSVSNICDICLRLFFWNSIYLLIKIWVYNQLLSQTISKIHKSIIHLEEVFHIQICIKFSACYEKSKTLDSPPGHSPCTLQPNLVFSTDIMYQVVVIFYCPSVYLMIHNNFRMIELDYISIHHSYLFLLNLHHSQTPKGWHHHTILIKIL